MAAGPVGVSKESVCGPGVWLLGRGGIADAGFLWAVLVLGRSHSGGVFKRPWVLKESQFDCKALWV